MKLGVGVGWAGLAWVAPHVGAWIETGVGVGWAGLAWPGRPPRGGVD